MTISLTSLAPPEKCGRCGHETFYGPAPVIYVESGGEDTYLYWECARCHEFYVYQVQPGDNYEAAGWRN